MPNEVNIRVNAQTGKTTESFQKTNAELKTLKKESVETSTRLKDMTNRLGAIAIGTLAANFGFQALVGSLNNMRQTAALTDVIVSQLGEGAVKNFEEMQKGFAEAGKEFGFTATQLEGAFGIISRESRSSKVDMDDLRFAMALARTAGISLAEASKIVGQAMIGNVEPLRSVTGELGSLEEIQQKIITSGEEATTVWQKMGAELRDTSEGVAGLVGKLLGLEARNDETFGEGIAKATAFKTAIEGAKDAFEELRTIGNFVERDLKNTFPEPIEKAFTFQTAIEGGKNAFEELAEVAKTGLNIIASDSAATGGIIKDTFGGAWEIVKNDTKDTVDALMDWFSDIVSGANNAAGAIAGIGPGPGPPSLPPVPVPGPPAPPPPPVGPPPSPPTPNPPGGGGDDGGGGGPTPSPPAPPAPTPPPPPPHPGPPPPEDDDDDGGGSGPGPGGGGPPDVDPTPTPGPSDPPPGIGPPADDFPEEGGPFFQTSMGQFRRVPGRNNQPVPAIVHGGEVIGRPGPGMGGITVNIFGDVKNEQTARELAREIKDLIQEDIRRGLGF